MGYFSIHNHTEFSIKDGFGHVEEMFDRALNIELKGIAFTEHNNVMSAPYAYELKKKNEKYKDLKFVYGVEFYECFDISIRDINNKYFHLIALAKNEKGRVAINSLITDSEFYGKYVKGRVDLNMMKKYADDIIVTSACLASKLSRECDYDKCIEYVNEYKSIFKHFYLEMQSHKSQDQYEYNKKILRLAKDTNTKFVITTDSHAPTEDMLEYQGRCVQIAQDRETMSESYEGCYLQSIEEIHKVMDSQIGKENVDLGLNNTLEILDLIDSENISVPFQSPILPSFTLPVGFNNSDDYLRHLCKENWFKRKFDTLSQAEQDVRKSRLEFELESIKQMGFSGYFLIVWDALNYGRENGVEIGRGRGSAGGSLVCYLTYITDVDPVKYGLIFERFLNPERVGLPDADIDLSPKEIVIQYLKEKYGRYRVCQVMNLSYITPLLAIKDTIRVLDRDEDRIEKGWKIGATNANDLAKYFTERDFDKCIEQASIPDKFKEEKYDDVYRIARMLSGRIRHTSTHAGGVGIVDTNINEYMPMHLSKDGEQVIQVDKHYVEDIGIVKFDFLGLGTLNVIKEARELANLTNWDLDPNNPVFENDTKAYELLSSGNTNCVFQVESQGMKDLLVRVKPTKLSEVCDVISLYRPDSMDVLEDYIAVKNGEKEATYIHDDMKDIFKDTYGQMAYQEQLMNVVRKFGGRTYGGSDKFRKGIGKKDIELVKKEADTLYYEIKNNGYSEDVARKISDNMASKGGYMFNLSHGIEYAVTTLSTAYLKANYTVEFFCAVLNQACNDGGKVNKYILDAQSFGVQIVCPHINKSKKKFTVVDGKILFGFNSINGIGDSVIDLILSERENGKFLSMCDLVTRVKLNKAQVVALIKSGALPTKSKKEMIKEYALMLMDKEVGEYKEYSPVKSLPSILELKTKWNVEANNKEERLVLFNEARKKHHDTVGKQEWLSNQKQKRDDIKKEFMEKYMQDEAFWEFESLSIFLENNPFKDIYQYITQDFYTVEEGMECIVVGVISSIQKKKDRNKKDYAYVRVYESEGILEGIAWNQIYNKYIDVIKKGNKLAFYGEKSGDESFIIKKIKGVDEWIQDRKLGNDIKF